LPGCQAWRKAAPILAGSPRFAGEAGMVPWLGWGRSAQEKFCRNSLRTFGKIFQMRLRPQPSQLERELARSEGRYTGASKRLFEGLPALAKACGVRTIQ